MSSVGEFQGFQGEDKNLGVAIPVNILSGGIGYGLGKKLGKPGPPGKNLDKQLAKFSRELAAASRPTRTAYYGQLGKALQGKSVMERQPDTLLALEHRRSGASQAEQQALEGIAAQDLGRSTAGASTLAGAQAAGRQTVALTPSDVLMQYIQAAPAAVVGQAQQGVIQPLGQLGELAAQRYLQAMEQQGAIWGGIGQGVGTLAGYGASRLGRGAGTPDIPGGPSALLGGEPAVPGMPGSPAIPATPINWNTNNPTLFANKVGA